MKIKPAMKHFKILVLLLVILFSSKGYAEIIPSGNRTTWSPGIPGGIPEIAGPVRNVMDYGGDPSGVDDSSGPLIAAIAGLPAEGGVVLLPQGTFRLTSKISISKDNIVIRGEGVDKTRIICDHTDNCFEVITYRRGDWQNLVTGFEKGSNTITVADGKTFTPGQKIQWASYLRFYRWKETYSPLPILFTTQSGQISLQGYGQMAWFVMSDLNDFILKNCRREDQTFFSRILPTVGFGPLKVTTPGFPMWQMKQH